MAHLPVGVEPHAGAPGGRQGRARRPVPVAVPASDLPKIVAAAAVFSVLLGLGFARLLARLGPMRVVPAAFAVGSLLHCVEFVLLRHRRPTVVRAVVVTVVYLHLVGFGAILLSGFWSVANEVVRSARSQAAVRPDRGAGTVGRHLRRPAWRSGVRPVRRGCAAGAAGRACTCGLRSRLRRCPQDRPVQRSQREAGELCGRRRATHSGRRRSW